MALDVIDHHVLISAADAPFLLLISAIAPLQVSGK
jgi:hypothetical protein